MVYSRKSCSLYINDFQIDGFESIRVGVGVRRGVDGESASVVGLSAAYESSERNLGVSRQIVTK